LAQAVVPIAPGDTPERLAQRVLALEHRMLPECVRWFLQDELVFEGERVRHRGGASQLFMAP
jgi:phosphoribosylglycinamide formyltransferase-1